MNYAHLAKTYMFADVIVHDRTYAGLQWLGPGEKPSEEQFRAFQVEEDRQNFVKNNLPKQKEADLMKERQRQARAAAEDMAIPLEKKIEAEWQSIYNEIADLRKKAAETRGVVAAMGKMGEAWAEISKAQESINEEAQRYLAETDWYYTRESETKIQVPEEVKVKRQEARERIQHGEIVYASWQKLRAAERPSRQEIRDAIREGGEALDRIRKLCGDASLKFPKPKRKIF